jgi:hypothetical protein
MSSMKPSHLHRYNIISASCTHVASLRRFSELLHVPIASFQVEKSLKTTGRANRRLPLAKTLAYNIPDFRTG